MLSRVVRNENGLWRIRSDEGELDQKEQDELKDYFNEIEMPYQYDAEIICISGSVTWETIYERLRQFYDGRAQVYPF